MAEGDLWLCEGAGEGPNAPPHVRRLTMVGPKPLGGPDTAALCMKRATADVREFNPAFDLAEGMLCRLCAGALRMAAGKPAVSVPVLGRAQRLAPVTRLPRPGLRRR